MPVPSCDCQRTIIREGLTYFIQSSIHSMFDIAETIGIESETIYDLLGQLISGTCNGMLPIATLGKAPEKERQVIGYYLHMMREIITAGYSPNAFRECVFEFLESDKDNGK